MKNFIVTLLTVLPLNYTFADKALNIDSTFSGKVWVIDGDSLRITLDDLTKQEVRIFGIDAPELSTPQGMDAKSFMIGVIKRGGRKATCKIIDIDKYKRNVSICTNKNGDLAKILLKAGHARIFKRFIINGSIKLQKRYKMAEKIGKQSN